MVHWPNLNSHLVLLPEEVDALLRFNMNIFQQFPQLGHLSLPLPVDVELCLSASFRFCESLRQPDDLQLQVVLLPLDPLPQVLLRGQVVLQNVEAFLESPHDRHRVVVAGVDVGVNLGGNISGSILGICVGLRGLLG